MARRLTFLIRHAWLAGYLTLALVVWLALQ